MYIIERQGGSLVEAESPEDAAKKFVSDPDQNKLPKNLTEFFNLWNTAKIELSVVERKVRDGQETFQTTFQTTDEDRQKLINAMMSLASRNVAVLRKVCIMASMYVRNQSEFEAWMSDNPNIFDDDPSGKSVSLPKRRLGAKRAKRVRRVPQLPHIPKKS